jgi:D-galacturonate reductase
MFTQGKTEGGLIFHDDQYRGVKHSYIHKGSEAEDSLYNEPSPDYFKYVERGGKGLTPVGYGYRSIEGLVAAVHRVEAHSTDSDAEEALKERKKKIKEIDREGIIATPANSSYNELVIEAGRMSILNGGREVGIEYGKHAGVKFV